MKRSEIFFGIVKIPLDFLATLLAFLAAYGIRAQTDLIPGIQLPQWPLPPFQEYLLFASISSAVLVAIYAANFMYSLKVSHKLGYELIKVLWLNIVLFMLIVAYFFFVREFFFSRLVLVYSITFATGLIFIVRILIRKIQVQLLMKGIGRYRVMFVGDNKVTMEVAKVLKDSKKYTIVGVLDSKPMGISTLSYKGHIEDIEKLVKKFHIDEVIQTKHKIEAVAANTVVDVCRLNHIRYRSVPDVVEMQLTHIEVSSEQGIPLIELKPTPLDGWGRVLKRTMDIIGSIVGIVILSPFWITTAIAVWVQMKSFKEIIFKQKRYGLHGQLFKFYKFQSMYVGAVKEHEKMMANSERGGLVKIKNDPRVTPVGRFIRKTSLDELPQLWSVLKGDMSLVGPRPHMPEEIDKVTKNYQRVLSIKPGLTGLAQVSGRSSLDFEKEMKLDLTYIANWSLWQDCIIILKTVGCILRQKDAS